MLNNVSLNTSQMETQDVRTNDRPSGRTTQLVKFDRSVTSQMQRSLKNIFECRIVKVNQILDKHSLFNV